MHSYTNRLVKETSPYLLQHAHNPVDWYAWGDEAFNRAKAEDKPVLVSIGYAACHWCHVMERESFEDPAVAAVMNEHFINIKVDREERPDVDGIYMDAVQAISGSGGWPLNVFLTPDGKPFYGGTYFPPRRAFNRPSWVEILESITKAYTEGKEQILSDAENLTEHLKSSNTFGSGRGNAEIFSAQKIEEAFKNILKSADKKWGGFGKAPKFPQTATITFLLRYAHLNNNKEALQQALLSLDKMIQGGLYDQVGGGFARYSTDTEWLAPHFEKMLYDNALLVSTLCEAYQLTGNDIYKEVITETLTFAERELMHPDGGFFSALDADSEGEEGKFYVWDEQEVKAVLGDDFDLFARYFDITSTGNWEEKNILRIKTPFSQFSEDNNVEQQHLKSISSRGKQKLLERRSSRIRPALDDKIILSWNALMNSAYSKAYAATSNPHFKEVAVRNMNFLLKNFRKEDQTFYHTWKGEGKHIAFLDDYSYLIAALLQLAQVTTDYNWLNIAQKLTETVLHHFKDEETPIFFFTPDFQTDIILRKKEIYDGATPSGNAVMAANLHYLSIIFDRLDWLEQAESLLTSLGDVIIRYPTSFGVWLSLLFEIQQGVQEIAVVGKDIKNKVEEVVSYYIPHKIIMSSSNEESHFPLLKDKPVNEQVLIYLCKNYACQQPVHTAEELYELLRCK